jgi:hypothetical protein
MSAAQKKAWVNNRGDIDLQNQVLGERAKLQTPEEKQAFDAKQSQMSPRRAEIVKEAQGITPITYADTSSVR